VAAALLEGRVGLEQFDPSRFADDGVAEPNVAELLPRIRVGVRDDLSRMYPARWPTQVTVATRDGQLERGMNGFPRGNPENPVSTETLEEKFLGLVGPRYGSAFAARALTVARAVGDCADVRTVFDSIR
jgi:2-methylcitrate dehydratase PrpD